MHAGNYLKTSSIRFGSIQFDGNALLEKRFMVTPRIFLWCRLIISTVTKNRLSFLVLAVLSNQHKKYPFFVSVA
jgi:hypothetical protein